MAPSSPTPIPLSPEYTAVIVPQTLLPLLRQCLPLSTFQASQLTISSPGSLVGDIVPAPHSWQHNTTTTQVHGEGPGGPQICFRLSASQLSELLVNILADVRLTGVQTSSQVGRHLD